MQEIWDAVISFKSDKAPGPDGISVEFYKECFQVIKYDLRKVLNLQKQNNKKQSIKLNKNNQWNVLSSNPVVPFWPVRFKGYADAIQTTTCYELCR